MGQERGIAIVKPRGNVIDLFHKCFSSPYPTPGERRLRGRCEGGGYSPQFLPLTKGEVRRGLKGVAGRRLNKNINSKRT
jgi:hypothetical protein